MSNRGSLITNLLTLLALLATLCVGGVVVSLLANPYLPINVFPPAALPPLAVIASPTATSTTSLFPTLPAAWTATFTPGAANTNTPAPTFTPLTTTSTGEPSPTRQTDSTPTGSETPSAQITDTDVPAGPTVTPSKTLTPFRFILQVGSPLPTQNFANDQGCNWMGIAGQAFDLNGNPIIGDLVRVEGNNKTLDSFTGGKPALGPGGYEITLDSKPVLTQGIYTVQLFDDNGVPLSDVIPFNTFADCGKNLILINFAQNH